MEYKECCRKIPICYHHEMSAQMINRHKYLENPANKQPQVPQRERRSSLLFYHPSLYVQYFWILLEGFCCFCKFKKDSCYFPPLRSKDWAQNLLCGQEHEALLTICCCFLSLEYRIISRFPQIPLTLLCLEGKASKLESCCIVKMPGIEHMIFEKGKKKSTILFV